MRRRRSAISGSPSAFLVMVWGADEIRRYLVLRRSRRRPDRSQDVGHGA